MSRRTSHRDRAEQVVSMLVTRAVREHWNAKRLRERIRTSLTRMKISDSIRYAAIRAVTGGGVLDIPDREQVDLIARGPRKRRTRRKERHGSR